MTALLDMLVSAPLSIKLNIFAALSPGTEGRIFFKKRVRRFSP